MMDNLSKFLFILLSFTCLPSFGQSKAGYDAIYSGVPLYDNQGNVVSAHGANIIRDNGQYYLFGEFKSDTSNTFNGFSCYSSTDLYNWKFENMALPVQDSGKLGRNRVGERVKVLKCPKTGEYVMYMHADDLAYKDQYVGFATCNKINGTYIFRGPLLLDGKPIKKWDMGVFQDTDGSGYIITHSGNLYKLSDDYRSVTEQVIKNMTPKCEAPVIFKKDSIYFWLGSDLTSWERNDNYYFTATSLKGPWISRGIFAPKGTLTWNSQSTYVLTIAGSKDTTFMFMGDRWSFPRQQSSATYVWQPLIVSGYSLSLPSFMESWQINTLKGTWNNYKFGKKSIFYSDKTISYSGAWIKSLQTDSFSDCRSEFKGSTFSKKFKGTRVGIYGVSRPNGGYAKVILLNSKGKTVLSSIIDMYCKYSVTSMKFVSPSLPEDNYTLILSVLGEHGNWFDKKGTVFGSKGNFVSIEKILIE